MTLQPMPLLERIRAGGRIDILFRPGQLEPDSSSRQDAPRNAPRARISQPLSPRLTRAARFDVQIAADLVGSGSRGKYQLAADVGSYRMPYPSMWFEWGYQGHRLGAWMIEMRTEGGIEARTKIFTASAGAVSMLGEVEAITMDPSGRFIDRRKQMARTDQGDLRRFYEDEFYWDADIEISRSDVDSYFLVPYFALGLINCKNVEIGEVRAGNPRSSDPVKRKRACEVSYHTISLPGMNGGGSSDRGNQDVMALHRVRGHFKTYTTEAPMLGKHTGTYWWGWQVRGNKKNGVTVTDYKIGERARVPA